MNIYLLNYSYCAAIKIEVRALIFAWREGILDLPYSTQYRFSG